MRPEDVPIALARAVENINCESAARDTSPPGPLYHYTSANGLLGILTSQSFWMTDIRYMNDLSESQYAIDVLATQLDERLANSRADPKVEEFIKRCRRILRSRSPGPAAFSVSFCESDNLLSQWRSYRGQGGGYAIGVDLVHTIRFLDKPCVLIKIIYNKDRQVELLDSVLDAFVDIVRQAEISLDEKKGKDLLAQACQVFVATTQQLLFSFKNPGFEEEREWRLVHLTHNNPRFDRSANPPKFRTFDGNVIPYHEVSFKNAIEASKDDTVGVRFPIVEVKIGPTVNAQLNGESVSSVLLGLAPDVEHYVSYSGIPLRWL